MNKTPMLHLRRAYSALIGKGNPGLLFTVDDEKMPPEQSRLYAPLYSAENAFIGTLELHKSSSSNPAHYWVSALIGPNEALPHNFPHVRLSIGDQTIFVINARTSEE
ncbi:MULTISPECIES: hypothetical protein [unclassified Saccharibacter]|uniref:hypothetical protein n=1 Tax=unclassified Saccharibacter TaxID=2648722 RepID=UPI00135541AE|nr:MULTISPECIES: hypothetical protein [unclassified Saccharibacter]MXV58402.1 hypothetical protein [Saccharibacter sp. EH70]MXV65848.1 hypothetical protein [Saccharibacter sp. EH60]